MIVIPHLSLVQLFETLWTEAHQTEAPLSMGFSRQKYWSGLPFPSLGDLPQPEIKTTHTSTISPALAGGLFTTRVTWKAHICD